MVSYPEPEWTTPYRICDPFLADRTPRMPSSVSAGIVSMIRNHFGSQERIIDRRISSHLWHPDRRRTILLIEPAAMYTPEVAGNRPSVIVGIGKMGSIPVTISGRTTVHMDSDNVFRGKDRIFKYSGEIPVIVRSSKPLETQIILEEIAVNFSIYGQEYADSLALGELNVIGLEPTKTITEEEGGSVRSYIASLFLKWTTIQDWTVATRGPLLRRGGITLPV